MNSCGGGRVMRPLVAMLFIAMSMSRAAEWFVAPAGDDAAAGTLDKPFGTLQRAQRSVGPGDTVFIRGGNYRLAESQIARTRGIFTAITYLNKSGQPGKRITYRAYQNEKPIFDCSAAKPAGKRVSAFHITGSWLHLIGLDVTGVQVTTTGHTQSICFESNGSHNIFERLSMHDGQAIGLYHVRGSSNLFLNCDAWNNWDYTSGDRKGGNVDGFGCHPSKGSVGNVLRGCRAWFNSDDGYDLISAHESVIIENCWALYSGFSPTLERTGDGNGFKAGGYGSTPANRLPAKIPRHVVRHCIAAGNKNSGFYANHHPGGIDWFNNSAYRNGQNFNLLGRLPDNVTDIDGSGHTLKNNLSHGARRDLTSINTAACELAANTFTLGLKLTDQDFASVNEKELLAPRQPDGSLPTVRFLRPIPGSPLIDAGVNIGLPYRGPKPDIGAIEK